ncbi:hypothetical protein NDU88_002080 [Pleurodeles waltl]|uniref:Uncharacterized protein n=1 Tax=Pleurodeles waltl TaxID=8319 RepID=A0AAV7VBV2_PLEWA|nr:hypothetical protein NDU88_002080 [Pleurodeles waltl]
MEMNLINFETLIRTKLLKLCREKGLKADRMVTKLGIQVLIRAFEEVQRWQSTSGGANDDEEAGSYLEDEEEKEDPDLGCELQREPNSIQEDDHEAEDVQDGSGSSVSARGLLPEELEDRKAEK